MNLTLHKLSPTPLREKINPNSSDIWMKDIVFKQGEHIFIQAPSGTGKTTLVHVLYGLRRDYEGAMLWGDDTIATMNGEQLAYMRATYVSVVFQDLRLFPELTVWENLELKRLLTNTMPQDRVEAMLNQLGIADKKEAIAKTLSYGEQQRVAIIRALLQPFDWLLMDEPFSHLDRMNIEKAAALISEVAAINKAGILLADLEQNNYFLYHKTLFL